MIEKEIQAEQLRFTDIEAATSDTLLVGRRWSVAFLFSTAGLIVCFLLALTPLTRIPDPVLTLHVPVGTFLAQASSWLPGTPGGLNATSSAYSELFGMLILAFLFYGLGALLVRRQPVTASLPVWRGLIWLGALVSGTLLLFTPATLSHDILVYASYSRVIATYHANPYFVPIAAFPHDFFAMHNYWSRAVSAYGPVWMLICGLFGWLLSPDVNAYTIAFRLCALLFYLLNIWLVGRILQVMGRSARTVTLGMLLYAWNPLLLLESALGGHNDGFMMTFVLVGVLLAVSAEKHEYSLRPRGYLPVVGALILAALVKFTALPILAVYLLFLVCKLLRPTADSPRTLALAWHNWRPTLLALLWSGLTALLLILVFYGPFWWRHDLSAIVKSFKSPPSSLYAENSFMRSIEEWHHFHRTLHSVLLDLLGNRHLWDALTLAAIVLCLLIGATRLWRRPTTRTFLVISLATMSLVLLITPWFFAWYLTWLLGLGITCLPVRLHRLETALLALVFTFGGSALFTYLFNGGLFGSHYYLVSLFTTIPPTCAFLLTLILWKPAHYNKTGAQKR